jgi:V/A-type H+-transporting ATPase subunit I
VAIEKMRFLSLVGDKEKLDYVIANSLLKSGIQLESAAKVFEKGWKLSYFSYNSEIKDTLRKIETLMKKLDISYIKKDVVLENSLDEIKQKIDEVNSKIEENHKAIEDKKEEIDILNKEIEPIKHLKNVDVDLGKLYKLDYMRFRFGKIPTGNLPELKEEMKKADVIFMELEQDAENTWILYFVSKDQRSKIDSLFNVFKFERVWLPQEVDGRAKDFLKEAEIFIKDATDKISQMNKALNEVKVKSERELENYYNQLILLEKVNNVKKYVAHDDKGSFYIFGWVPLDTLNDILVQLEAQGIECVVKTNSEVMVDAPTKLKNNRLVRPFETIVKMYGMPNYTEFDPTTFVALTAFLMFGFMFGDVGQGFVIFLIGLILSKKKVGLGPILTAGGISAMIFGVLYGSVFGKEGLIKPLLISPMENISTMLIAGIVSGVILIIMAMILNIKNGIKNKDKGKVLFDKNGVAGIVFYVSVLALIIEFVMTGKIIGGAVIVLLTIVLPIVLIMFKENIMSKIEKKKLKENSSLVEKIFEIVEMLLSFMSNTISFVRLAAFAINHVGLCLAVYVLAGLTSGAGSIAIAIIGNIIVIVLEGLIVAIQVLRLEYYELFSRFYAGDGREYKPIDELV